MASAARRRSSLSAAGESATLSVGASPPSTTSQSMGRSLADGAGRRWKGTCRLDLAALGLTCPMPDHVHNAFNPAHGSLIMGAARAGALPRSKFGGAFPHAGRTERPLREGA